MSGANHAEGGWPKDVHVIDPEATQRYRRKVEKDDGYIHCVMSLSAVCIFFCVIWLNSKESLLFFYDPNSLFLFRFCTIILI